MYNFIVFGSKDELYEVSYRNIKNTENSRYISEDIDTKSRVLNALYKLHCSKTTNKFVELPFKSIWNSQYLKSKFNNDNPYCFVIFGSQLWKFKYGLDKYLRKKYVGCKIVVFYQDIINNDKKELLEKYRDRLDLILTFDQKNAKEYNLIYYPLVYTPEELEIESQPETSDVYFLGKAKDRLAQILDIYSKLKAAGLKCDFNITGVKESDRKFADDINYCSGMTYRENVKHIKATKVMLEIMQGGGHGYTLRYCEAICYGKKLITNNPEVAKAPFYNPEFIQVLTDESTLDTDFVNKGDFVVDYNFKEELSPLKMFEFIEKNI